MPLTLALSGTWLADATNLADAVALDAGPIPDSPDDGGSVVAFAAGRQRYLSIAGTQRSLTINADPIDETTRLWLEAHRGVPLLLRTPTGLRRWVTFSKWVATPYLVARPDGTYWHVLTGLNCAETSRTDVV